MNRAALAHWSSASLSVQAKIARHHFGPLSCHAGISSGGRKRKPKPFFRRSFFGAWILTYTPRTADRCEGGSRRLCGNARACDGDVFFLAKAVHGTKTAPLAMRREQSRF